MLQSRVEGLVSFYWTDASSSPRAIFSLLELGARVSPSWRRVLGQC
jgi:hypothetical protein